MCQKRTAVVGAGYIAMEVAGVLHALGSKNAPFLFAVSVLYELFDKEIIDTLVDAMAENGPTFAHFFDS